MCSSISSGNFCQIVILISTFICFISFFYTLLYGQMDWTNVYGGTTIIAASYSEGVVMGADSRTSCHAFVSNRSADKLTRLTDQIYCCRSGSAAKTQSLSEYVARVMASYQRATGQPPLVRDAAVHFRNQIYGAENLLAGIIVAGWDKVYGGQVYSVTSTGLLIHEACAVSGSGGIYVQGYISAHFTHGMDREQAVDMVRNAIELAMRHDCSSGGVVRIGVITEKGMDTSIYHNKDCEIVDFANNTLWNLEFDR